MRSLLGITEHMIFLYERSGRTIHHIFTTPEWSKQWSCNWLRCWEHCEQRFRKAGDSAGPLLSSINSNDVDRQGLSTGTFAERDLCLRFGSSEDVFIVSYPRSGNTWSVPCGELVSSGSEDHFPEHDGELCSSIYKSADTLDAREGADTSNLITLAMSYTKAHLCLSDDATRWFPTTTYATGKTFSPGTFETSIFSPFVEQFNLGKNTSHALGVFASNIQIAFCPSLRGNANKCAACSDQHIRVSWSGV